MTLTAYQEEAGRVAGIRESYSLAVLEGKGDRAQLLADMRSMGAKIDRLRDADALTRFRAGEPVWCWPVTAPWEGF